MHITEDHKIETTVGGNVEKLTNIEKAGIVFIANDKLLQDTLEGLKSSIDTTPTFTWNMPHLRNPNFTGRKDYINSIKNVFSSSAGSTIIACVSGLGGVGKTQLAIEYAYENQNDYKLIWWLNAENDVGLESDYLKLVTYLNIQHYDEMKKGDLIGKIRQTLEARSDWLLIFDYADTLDSIDDYIPRAKAGHVLVTSRNQGWQNITKIIPMNVFDNNESIQYILKKLSIDESNNQMADKLAGELGNLPLALSQACAYIKATRMKIPDYLEMFKEYQIDILKEGKVEDYHDTIATTWSISIKAVNEVCSDSLYLLNFCAFMAPNDIPINLIKKGYNDLPWEGNKLFSNKIQMNKALSSLLQYSLVRYENGILSSNKLVQLVTKNNLDEDKKSIWIKSLIKVVNVTMPDDTYKKENRDIIYRLLPHISNIINVAEENQIRDKETYEDIISLVDKVVAFLYYMSDFKKSAEYGERSLKIKLEFGSLCGESERFTGPAGTYYSLGDYKKAIEYYEKGLNIYMEIGNKQGVSACYGNIGYAYNNLGDYKKAIEYFERGLNIYMEIGNRWGESTCFIGLGHAYFNLGDYKKAIEYYEKCLNIYMEIGDRRWESWCYDYLGYAYNSFGNIKKAIECYEKSLKIKLELGILRGGSECYMCLGNAYNSMGVYDKAIEYYEKGLNICMEIGNREGESWCYIYLGDVYNRKGVYDKAIEYYEKGLNICMEIGDRRGISRCYDKLGGVCYDRGDYKTAIEYFEKGLKAKFAPGGRPGESMCYMGIGNAYNKLGDFKQAIENYEKSLNIKLELGDRQGESMCYMRIGDAYNNLGNIKKAIEYYKMAANGFKKLKQKNDYKTVQNNLSILRKKSHLNLVES